MASAGSRKDDEFDNFWSFINGDNGEDVEELYQTDDIKNQEPNKNEKPKEEAFVKFSNRPDHENSTASKKAAAEGLTNAFKRLDNLDALDDESGDDFDVDDIFQGEETEPNQQDTYKGPSKLQIKEEYPNGKAPHKGHFFTEQRESEFQREPEKQTSLWEDPLRLDKVTDSIFGKYLPTVAKTLAVAASCMSFSVIYIFFKTLSRLNSAIVLCSN